VNAGSIFLSSRARRRGLGFTAVTLALLAGAVGAALLAGRDDSPAPSRPTAEDPGPLHVHGLGRNPRDGALFIATHTGIWRLAQGNGIPERVGVSRQDTMGFTVVGPDRFFGSGHPDVREATQKGLPPHLGLIESRDAGRSWTTVSLLGRADFHVLRAAGRQIYGLDSSSGRLLVSSDSGKSWSERRIPAPVVDLAPHPEQPRVVLATTNRGFYRSTDAGKTWTRVGDGVGLLTWPRTDRLYLISQGGQVFESPDAGARWRQAGNLPGDPAALFGAGPQDLYAALHDGTITHSPDGGVSWVVRARP